MRMHNPAHPGEVLRAFIPEGMRIHAVAERLHISRVQLSRLLNGHASMSAEMALRVAALTGTSAESWLENQVQWDLWQAQQRPQPEIQPLFATAP